MTTDPREALREMIAEVAQREFENSITTAGTIAFRDYLGARIAAEVMCLFPDVEQESRPDWSLRWCPAATDERAPVEIRYTLRTAPEPLAAAQREETR